MRKEQLEALGYRVLVELEAIEKVTEGGIILNIDDDREKRGMDTGTILDIGPLAFRVHGGPEKWGKKGLKIGDKVFFNRYEGKYIAPFEDDPEEHSGYVALEDEHIAFRVKPE